MSNVTAPTPTDGRINSATVYNTNMIMIIFLVTSGVVVFIVILLVLLSTRARKSNVTIRKQLSGQYSKPSISKQNQMPFEMSIPSSPVSSIARSDGQMPVWKIAVVANGNPRYVAYNKPSFQLMEAPFNPGMQPPIMRAPPPRPSRPEYRFVGDQNDPRRVALSRSSSRGSNQSPHLSPLQNVKVPTSRTVDRDISNNNQQQTSLPNIQEMDSGEATLISTTNVLSMPGFLQLEYGSQFRTMSKLSQGGSAVVYQGEVFSNVTLPIPYENPVVVKQVLIKDKKNTGRILLAYRQEVAILWLLHDHPNIVKLIGYSENEMMIIMKFYPKGSLYGYIYDKTVAAIEHGVMLTIFKDIASALQILHLTGIVHNDLKPANILMEDRDQELRAVLADFGISHVVDKRISGVEKMVVQNIVGASTFYAAPEVLLRLKKLPTPLSPRIARGGDCYSFGIVMFELINRRLYGIKK